MWPRTEIMMASTRPWARAIPRSPPGSLPRRITTDPAPMKMRANAPKNSAVARCQIRSTRLSLAVARLPAGRELSPQTGRRYNRRMKVLLVSPLAESRELMGLAVAGISRRLGRPLEFLEAADGERGMALARREQPDVV